MAQKFHARQAYFSVEDSTSASRAFHPDGGTITWDESGTNPEVTAFGDPGIQRAASGFWDLKVTFDGFGDWSANAPIVVMESLKSQPTVIVFGPGGSTSGCPKFSACVLATDWSVNSQVKDFVKFKASFELRTGSPTYGTFP